MGAVCNLEWKTEYTTHSEPKIVMDYYVSLYTNASKTTSRSRQKRRRDHAKNGLAITPKSV